MVLDMQKMVVLIHLVAMVLDCNELVLICNTPSATKAFIRGGSALHVSPESRLPCNQVTMEDLPGEFRGL